MSAPQAEGRHGSSVVRLALHVHGSMNGPNNAYNRVDEECGDESNPIGGEIQQIRRLGPPILP
ncbi:MAG: hypothetical protein KF747_19440 [Nitrospira sp.]|nr:hypothetical protein [Nitrospira sp.]